MKVTADVRRYFIENCFTRPRFTFCFNVNANRKEETRSSGQKCNDHVKRFVVRGKDRFLYFFGPGGIYGRGGRKSKINDEKFLMLHASGGPTYTNPACLLGKYKPACAFRHG